MKSIKIKITVLFSSLILIVMSGTGLLITNTLKKSLINDNYSELESISKFKSESIQEKIKGELLYIQGLARNKIIIDTKISLEEKNVFLKNEAKNSGYNEFIFSDRSGNAISFENFKEEINIVDRDYFQKAINGNANVSDLLISKVSGELVMVYATPVRNSKQEIVGVLYGEKDFNELSKSINGFEYKDTGYAYIINNHGTVVAHPNIDLVIRQYNLYEESKNNKDLKELANIIKNKMVLRKTGSATYFFDGKNRVVGFSPIENTEWIIITAMDEEEVLNKVQNMRILIISITGFFILIAFFIIYII